jgi:hypothetical protein
MARYGTGNISRKQGEVRDPPSPNGMETGPRAVSFPWGRLGGSSPPPLCAPHPVQRPPWRVLSWPNGGNVERRDHRVQTSRARGGVGCGKGLTSPWVVVAGTHGWEGDGAHAEGTTPFSALPSPFLRRRPETEPGCVGLCAACDDGTDEHWRAENLPRIGVPCYEARHCFHTRCKSLGPTPAPLFISGKWEARR